MDDKHRKQRQAKRAESKRKKRADASRPGVGGPATASSSASKGRTWPTGECYVSEGWEEPGARIELVFSRSRADGGTVMAAFELDRSGPGIVSARAAGGLRREHVAGECGAMSERTGRAMIGCSPGLIAALVADARHHGSLDPGGAEAIGLLEGVPRAELPVPFGPAIHSEGPEPPRGEGWLGGLRKRLFGSP
jgi:hypothetical protein